MKQTMIAFVVIAFFASLAACSSKSPELKSPCVGAEGSPCGPRRAVNDWWMRA